MDIAPDDLYESKEFRDEISVLVMKWINKGKDYDFIMSSILSSFSVLFAAGEFQKTHFEKIFSKQMTERIWPQVEKMRQLVKSHE